LENPLFEKNHKEKYLDVHLKLNEKELYSLVSLECYLKLNNSFLDSQDKTNYNQIKTNQCVDLPQFYFCE
jgi:beta-galactosidase beta subunit